VEPAAVHLAAELGAVCYAAELAAVRVVVGARTVCSAKDKAVAGFQSPEEERLGFNVALAMAAAYAPFVAELAPVTIVMEAGPARIVVELGFAGYVREKAVRNAASAAEPGRHPIYQLLYQPSMERRIRSSPTDNKNQ